ncbi:hypothetical protein [Streptomyces broussonetiae]|uniref:hypothetical protein n=1 Tax=Streptomyces broussonetiae TaxID=2686304 RepID=UPI0035DF80EA
MPGSFAFNGAAFAGIPHLSLWMRGAIPEHTLRTAFAPGLDGALVVAGLAGTAAATLVLLLVRAGRPTKPTEPGAAAERAVAAHH